MLYEQLPDYSPLSIEKCVSVSVVELNWGWFATNAMIKCISILTLVNLSRNALSALGANFLEKVIWGPSAAFPEFAVFYNGKTTGSRISVACALQNQICQP